MAAALAAATLGVWTASAAAASVEVAVDGGRVDGVRDAGLEIFKGVPYAAPPIGERRWAPPAPVQAWTGVRPAADFGPVCPQPRRPDGAAAAGADQPQSEDCLTLNIWSFAGARKAPVMVWIHGGAFRFGSGSARIYDGAPFARDGVILVSLNYRLGALGWFAHPALTRAASPDEPLVNYGLMDQIAALRWVQHNIAAFGGDPANVTVFGESAGGESVLALLSAPSAKGLFAKAIVESGGGWGADKTLAQAEAQGSSLATAAGLGPDATPQQLRALPVDKLFALPMTLGAVGPVTDGRLLPQSVTRTFAASRQIAAPLIIGSNSYEASLMRSFRIPPQTMLARVPATMRALYPGDDDKAASDLFTDAIMGAPSRWVAARQSAVAPTWLYRFDYVPTLRRGSAPGTQHGGEIPFVFATWSALAGPAASADDQAMERLAHGCWIAFAKTGTPACGDPKWPAYTPAQDRLMAFGVSSGPAQEPREAQYDALQQTLLPLMEAAR
ncbi:carboxylesterase/lipase family protein [Caulobacter sp. KR2-114]|uniref:carboxylesterase/lipase family protein n=1 Tax=Caulobacter sp. KR2-114 TaxID=3400912 RepID=UPI003BFCA54F